MLRAELQAKSGVPTIGQIMDLYIADRRREGKNDAKMGYQWKALQATFANLLPTDIERPVKVAGEQRTLCHRYAVTRADEGRARDTIVSELSLLRTALNWAGKRRLIATVPHVWVPSSGGAREIALSPDRIVRLLGAIVEAPTHTRLVILIALATGARRTAILELTWDRVDLERRVIDFNVDRDRSILDTSHQKGRAVVDFGEALHEALSEAKAWARTDHVIEYRGRALKNVHDGVKAIFAKAGISERYTGLHALRHTLATSALSAGIDMRKVQRMLGHKTITTTEQVYSHWQQGLLSEVARVADTHVARLNADKLTHQFIDERRKK